MHSISVIDKPLEPLHPKMQLAQDRSDVPPPFPPTPLPTHTHTLTHRTKHLSNGLCKVLLRNVQKAWQLSKSAGSQKALGSPKTAGGMATGMQ